MCTCGKLHSSRRGLLAGLGATALLGGLRPAWGMDNGGSLHQASGTVTINGRPAAAGDPVASGDAVAAGSNAMAVFTLGDDAFLLRAEGAVTVSDREGIRAVSLEQGRLLSVFGPKTITLSTPQASIGIRGTAVYLEARPTDTTICVCYGHAVMTPLGAPEQAEEVRTRHHDAPRRVFGSGHVPAMEPYAALNHTDDELVMLEALLGRLPPFLRK